MAVIDSGQASKLPGHHSHFEQDCFGDAKGVSRYDQRLIEDLAAILTSQAGLAEMRERRLLTDCQSPFACASLGAHGRPRVVVMVRRVLAGRTRGRAVPDSCDGVAN